MFDTLLEVLQHLTLLNFSAHVYGSPSTGWFYNGSELANATHELFTYVFDEHDKRIEIYKITSSCGSIKGAAIVT